jgi:hypothetical protein
VRAMRLKRSDAPLLVAENDELLAEQLHLLWQIGQLIRGAHRLPVAAQEFTHRASLLDAGHLVVRWRCLRSVGRFHHYLRCDAMDPSLSRRLGFPEFVRTNVFRSGPSMQPVSRRRISQFLPYDGFECWTWVPGNKGDRGKRR